MGVVSLLPMRSVSALTLVVLAASACAQPVTPKPDPELDARQRRADSALVRPAPTPDDAASGATTTDHGVELGDALVVVRVTVEPGEGGLDALNLHDDEETSVEAAKAVVGAHGGRVVELVHSGERNVTFGVGGRTYQADPNRMFTEAGRRRTLASLSQADDVAEAALEAFADSVLALYTAVEPVVVVTLHNNTDENYSARSYAAGAEYATDAAAVTIHPGTDADDFFFVTDRAIYDALVARGFNAVLQDNDAATDDGSLSVWAARHGVPYVNVEAQHGHTEAQSRMLEVLREVIAR